MRLAADTADIQRSRATVRADRYRQQLMLQEQGEEFVRARRTTMAIKGLLPASATDMPHADDWHTSSYRPHTQTSHFDVQNLHENHQAAAGLRSSGLTSANIARRSDGVKAQMVPHSTPAGGAYGESHAALGHDYEASAVDESYASDFESMDSSMHSAVGNVQVRTPTSLHTMIQHFSLYVSIEHSFELEVCHEFTHDVQSWSTNVFHALQYTARHKHTMFKTWSLQVSQALQYTARHKHTMILTLCLFVCLCADRMRLMRSIHTYMHTFYVLTGCI
jgi:hypothetical protein